MKTIAKARARVEDFPETRIRDRLISLWNEKVEQKQDDPFKPKIKITTLHAVLPVFDSLEVVKSMIVIEEIIDTKIPPRFIRQGGYNSGEEMINHLMPQLRKLCSKK